MGAIRNSISNTFISTATIIAITRPNTAVVLTRTGQSRDVGGQLLASIRWETMTVRNRPTSWARVYAIGLGLIIKQRLLMLMLLDLNTVDT